MEYSNTLRLNEPEDGDGFDIGHFNENSESLDNIIGGDIASIASAEASSTATKAHAVGSYLTMGGKLYRVTSAIAIGDTISTSTNVTETSLLNEINTLQEFAGNLESSIAPVESTTATTNHAVGDYFMLGNVLMCATTAIATGEQITTSNATPATIQSQIDTLRDSVSQKSVTFTPTSEITNASFAAIRIGRMVMFTLLCDIVNAHAAWTDTRIGTISPTPSMNIFPNGVSNNGTVRITQISTDGSVWFRTLDSPTTGAVSYRSSFTYISQ